MSEAPNSFTDMSVLTVFGHPDDEGFGCGGTMAILAGLGARITTVCATNGDVGEISDPTLATHQTLGRIRQCEMRKAMEVLGIRDVRFLGYRDSGMAGTRDNDHPESLYKADPAQVVEQIVELIRETNPHVVITHDPTGGYGHPDHTTIHHHVTQAFPLASDINYPIGPNPGRQTWQPGLLYYVCFPKSNFRNMWQQMLDEGITPPFASLDLDNLGTPDELVTTVVDVTKHVDVKIASLNCHRTQMDPNGPFAKLPERVLQQVMSTEYFTLAFPQVWESNRDLLSKL